MSLPKKKNSSELSFYDFIKEIPKFYLEYPFLKEVDSCTLRYTIFNLDNAYKNIIRN